METQVENNRASCAPCNDKRHINHSPPWCIGPLHQNVNKRLYTGHHEGMSSHFVGSKSAPVTNAQTLRDTTVNRRCLLPQQTRQTSDSNHWLSSYLTTRIPNLVTCNYQGHSTNNDRGVVPQSLYQFTIHRILWHYIAV